MKKQSITDGGRARTRLTRSFSFATFGSPWDEDGARLCFQSIRYVMACRVIIISVVTLLSRLSYFKGGLHPDQLIQGLAMGPPPCLALPAAGSLPVRRSASCPCRSPLSRPGQNIVVTLHRFAKYNVTRRATLLFMAESQFMQRHETTPARAWNTKIMPIIKLFSGQSLYMCCERRICSEFSLFQRAWIFWILGVLMYSSTRCEKKC